jgi:hypothetical protein
MECGSPLPLCYDASADTPPVPTKDLSPCASARPGERGRSGRWPGGGAEAGRWPSHGDRLLGGCPAPGAMRRGTGSWESPPLRALQEVEEEKPVPQYSPTSPPGRAHGDRLLDGPHLGPSIWLGPRAVPKARAKDLSPCASARPGERGQSGRWPGGGAEAGRWPSHGDRLLRLLVSVRNCLSPCAGAAALLRRFRRHSPRPDQRPVPLCERGASEGGVAGPENGRTTSAPALRRKTWEDGGRQAGGQPDRRSRTTAAWARAS